MHREWSIADGPADLTDNNVGQECTFTQSGGGHLRITLTSVGRMFGGTTRSFSGRIKIDHQAYEVIGTYNLADRTGHCHTTDAAI